MQRSFECYFLINSKTATRRGYKNVSRCVSLTLLGGRFRVVSFHFLRVRVAPIALRSFCMSIQRLKIHETKSFNTTVEIFQNEVQSYPQSIGNRPICVTLLNANNLRFISVFPPDYNLARWEVYSRWHCCSLSLDYSILT